MPVADGHPSFCIYLRLTYGGINYPAIYVALLLEDYFIFHNFVERSKNSFMGIIIFLLIAIGGWMLIPSFFWAIVFEIIVIAAGFFIISKKNG